MESLNDFILNTIALLFIVNPLNGAILFIELTPHYSEKKRTKSALTAAIGTAALLMFFSITGSLMFNLFGFTLSAFQIAGGFVIFSAARTMTQGQTPAEKNTPEEAQSALQKDDIAMVPLATPMLVGPGAISTVILGVSHMSRHTIEMPLHCLTILIVAVTVYIALNQSHILLKKLGPNIFQVFTRLMGLVMMALGVQYVLNGLSGYLPTVLSNLPK